MPCVVACVVGVCVPCVVSHELNICQIFEGG